MSTSKTGIEWCDRTWNPVRGCSRVSAGCDHCYAEGIATRFSGPGLAFEGFARSVHGAPHWTGRVELDEAALDEPLRWRKPAAIFANSMSDLFHKALPDEAIDRVFAVMALCPQHTFLVLTKRPQRMAAYLEHPETPYRLEDTPEGLQASHHATSGDLPYETPTALRLGAQAEKGLAAIDRWQFGIPLRNIYLGASVEDQATADARVPHLLRLAALGWPVWASYEPALGPVDWTSIRHQLAGKSFELLDALRCQDPLDKGHSRGRLSAIVAGGESGRGARPPHPDWFRTTRDQCAAAGVPFHFKQWGAWTEVLPEEKSLRTVGAAGSYRPVEARFVRRGDALLWRDGSRHILGAGLSAPGEFEGPATPMRRVGKAFAGRLLDGRTHDDLPWR